MIVIPAIDIIEGQAVRLYKGDYSKKEIIGQKIIIQEILIKQI